MRKVLVFISIINTLCFGCKENNFKKNNSMEEYKCIFEGSKSDMFNFLGTDNLIITDLKVLKFANHYTFSQGENSLMLYVHDEKNQIFETFRPEGISAALKTDRKYKMYLSNYTKKGFKMIIESNNKTFTRMIDKQIVITCNENVENLSN